jgi:hypothetical protein
MRRVGGWRERKSDLLTALSSISCWAFFWAASMVTAGAEPNSRRKMKDMDSMRGGGVLEKRAKRMRGKWALFIASYVETAGTCDGTRRAADLSSRTSR